MLKLERFLVQGVVFKCRGVGFGFFRVLLGFKVLLGFMVC